MRSLSLHMSSIPKINKTQFICSYLQEQKTHAKMYAAQGRAFELSWNREGGTDTPRSPVIQEKADAKLSVIDYGFGTPVLKPRVGIRHIDGQEQPAVKESKATAVTKSTRNKDATKVDRSDQEQKPIRKRARSRTVIKEHESRPQSYKANRTANADSEYPSEREKRLKERRDRKRAKRAVMQPTADNGPEDEAPQETQKKRAVKKDVKGKGQMGLALMHGFTATNVGSGRLTVKPAFNIGVFNKGKASAKSRTTNHKPSTSKKTTGHLATIGFSENDFLNKSRQTSRQSKRKLNLKPDVSSFSSSSSTSATTSIQLRSSLANHTRKKACKYKTNPEPRRLRKNASSTSVSKVKTVSSIANDRTKTKKLNDSGRPESIVWDIELDDASLPSQAQSVQQRVPSVLVNTKNTSWGLRAGQLEVQTTPVDYQTPQDVRSDVIAPETKRDDSSSIGPSESASQCGGLLDSSGFPHAEEAASKYFAPVAQLHAPLSARSPPKGNSHETDSNRRGVVAIEPPSCEVTSVDLGMRPKPPMASQSRTTVLDDPVLQPCDTDSSFVHDVEYLPLVDPQDYQYSDYAPWEWVPGDEFGGILPDATVDYGDNFEEQLFNNNLSFHQWHELEGMHQDEFYIQTTDYEEERYCMQDESLDGDENRYDDDGYDSPEYEDTISWNTSPIHGNNSTTSNSDNNYHTINFEDSPSIGYLCTENKESDGGFPGRFAEGKALLLGYAENGVQTFVSTRLPYRPQLSRAEADVAKRLKNHWLPQHL
ncbi:hypothetical protein H0H87_005665 [Tephrocybe sp. NHM501043]|nr:hypothetical protein H0H87_005665 [Tephrocybe sp. NHM501043]